MVGTVVLPTLSGLRRASSRRQQVAGSGLLLPNVNGLVPWLLARSEWLAGAGVSALVVDPLGGQGTGAAQPANCNRACR